LAGGVLSYLAVLVVSPVVVPALIGLVGRGLRRLPRRWRGGVPVRVAVLESKRSPRRTAGAVTAFTVGVTLITMLCVGAASVAETQARAVDRIAPVDVVLSGGAVPTGLAGRLSTLDEVGDVVVVGGGYASIGERRVQVASLSGPPAARVVRDGLLREQITDPHRIVVPVAAQSAVRRDSSARITLRGRSDSVRLSPVYASLPSGPLLVSPAVLDRLGVRKRPEALFLRLSDAADPVSSLQAIGAVVAAGRDRGLVVAGSYGERTTYHQLVTTMLVTAVAMLAVAVVIALVGLGNTLSLSITERTREYGLLRSLGLTRRQLRLLLTTESLLLALAAVGIGIVLGIGYGWIGTVVLLHGALNHAPTLVVPIGQLGVVGGVAVVAGLAASLLPARHGLALSPVEALARD
jgi:putative ABC transport system permease protein